MGSHTINYLLSLLSVPFSSGAELESSESEEEVMPKKRQRISSGVHSRVAWFEVGPAACQLI